MSRRIASLLLAPLFALLLTPLPAAAANESGADAMARSLARLEATVGTGSRAAVLRETLRQTELLRADAVACAAEQDRAARAITRDMAQLGEARVGEPAEVTQKRAALEESRNRIEAAASGCRLLVLRAEELIARVAAIQRAQFRERLFERGPALWELWTDEPAKRTAWVQSTRSYLADHSGLGLFTVERLLGLLAVLALGTLAGLRIRRQWNAWAATRRWGAGLPGRFAHAVVLVCGRYSAHLFATALGAVFVHWIAGAIRPTPFVVIAAYGVPVYFLGLALLDLLLRPPKPAEPVLTLAPAVARPLVRRFKALLLLVFVGYLLFSTLAEQSLSESALLIARGLFVAAFVVNLAWALRILRALPGQGALRRLLSGLALVLFAAVAAEWVGYRNMAWFIVQGVLGTALAAGFLALGLRVVHEAIRTLHKGSEAWAQGLRDRLELEPGAAFPGAAWARLLADALLWLAAGYVLLKVWGVWEAWLPKLYEIVFIGIGVGSLHIVPSRLALAFAVFLGLYFVARWVQHHLEHRWLREAPLEKGAREAAGTIAGYVGVALAAIVALVIAGLNFQNLAIIAGALSVGIGFGLQNIVNNFVSGLILLFERPIRPGDWIQVGTTEGRVQRISIRSTRIRTFDGADVIVPNSALISGEVTNWMLQDIHGRVVIPIGVAYGSDLKKVERILLEVAQAHPLVILDGTEPAPKVLFRQFGASSLDFELRAFVTQVDQRVQVTNDLLHAIDAAFRAEGIEIPFPQQDVHVRSGLPAAEPPRG